MTGATVDGAALLGRLAGIPREEVLSIWEQVKVNKAKLDNCAQHRFEAKPVKIGERQTCLACGGNMSLSAVGEYIHGYEAHGGNADDVWPGYRDKKTA